MARGKKLAVIPVGPGIKMEFDPIQLDRVNMHVLNGATGLVTTAMRIGGNRLVKRVQDEIVRLGHVDSGELKDSIKVLGTDLSYRHGVSISVGSDLYYAPYVNDGTADRGSGYIFPTEGPILVLGGSRFRAGKPAGPKVYATQVRGQRGTQFFEAALRKSRISDFTRGI